MTDEAKAARREYERKWRAKNPDKVKAKLERYWEKKAAENTAERGEPDAQDKADS